MQVHYKPEGFNTVSPFLIAADAAAALAFYENVFGAVIIDRMTRPDGTIMHAEFRIGDSTFMLGGHAEVQPRDTERFPATSLYLYVEDAEAVHARAVQAGATSLFAVADKFYGNREGGIADPAGIVWWIATRVEALSGQEIASRAAQFFKPAQ